MMTKSNAILFVQNRLIWLVFLFATVWFNTLLGTTDRANWLIENILTMCALLFLFISYRHFQFSYLSYFLIFLFLCLHVYGSKYTYAENPLGFWLKDIFHSSRNQYDRIVHFSFGFLLYYPLREFFTKWLKYTEKLANYLPILLLFSFSALYEIIEWLVADIFFVELGISYLGTQGDVWDAQKDSSLAFLGMILSFTFFVIKAKFKKKEVNRYGNTIV